MGYDELEFANFWLREKGVRRMYAIKYYDPSEEPSLGVDTDDISSTITISSREQTKLDLDKELSLQVEDVGAIRAALAYFDEIWDEIDEYVSEPIVKGEGKAE